MSKDLPKRWLRRHGAIYYQVPREARHLWDNKTQFRLGSTEAEAFRTWNDRVQQGAAKTQNVSCLIDDWITDHVMNPKRVRPATTRYYLASLKHIRPVFGHMTIGEIRRSEIKQYYMIRYDKLKTAAKKELETLSAFLGWCMDRDLIDYNPALRLNVPKPAPRKHYVEDYDVQTFMQFAGDLLSRYIPLKIYTGARKGDLLALRTVHWSAEGLYVGDRKSLRALTGDQKLGRIYRRTQELEEIMDQALVDSREWIFETSAGNPYIDFETDKTEGFDSVWQRAKQRALKSGEMMQSFDSSKPNYIDYVEARALKVPLVFQDRDLRAKTATDSDSIAHAQQRLGHSSSTTTQRVYNRKPIFIE